VPQLQLGPAAHGVPVQRLYLARWNELGMSQADAATLLGICKRTPQN
jgi:DNA-binding XRE family transcriptional regulator